MNDFFVEVYFKTRMSDREYVVLNTSIRTGSNSNQLLVNEAGDVQATVDLLLPDNIFSSNTGATKVADVEMQTSKMRLSMINTPVAELPLDLSQTKNGRAVTTCQLDVYPYSILDNNRIVPVPGNPDASMPFSHYKEHFVNIVFKIVTGWTVGGIPQLAEVGRINVRANANDSFPESRYSELVDKAGLMYKYVNHQMALMTGSNRDYEIDGDKLYIRNIGTLEQMLQDAIENAITYASTSTQSELWVVLVPSTMTIPENSPLLPTYKPDLTNTIELKEFEKDGGDPFYAYFWMAVTPEILGSPDTTTAVSGLKWAVKPIVKITDNGISISYDTAAFDKTIPIMWNTAYVDTGDQPLQMSLDSIRNEVWTQPPPKRVYKYGVATSEETYTNTYDGDMKGYQFTLPDSGQSTAPFNIVVNDAFHDTFSFLPWVEIDPNELNFGKLDEQGMPDVPGLQTEYYEYTVSLEATKQAATDIEEFIILTNFATDSDKITKNNARFGDLGELWSDRHRFNSGDLVYTFQLDANETFVENVYTNRKNQNLIFPQLSTSTGGTRHETPLILETIDPDDPFQYEDIGTEKYDEWTTSVPQVPPLVNGEVIYNETQLINVEAQISSKGTLDSCLVYKKSGSDSVRPLYEGTFKNNVRFTIPNFYPPNIVISDVDPTTNLKTVTITWSISGTGSEASSIATSVDKYVFKSLNGEVLPMTFARDYRKEDAIKFSVTQYVDMVMNNIYQNPSAMQQMYLGPNISNVETDEIRAGYRIVPPDSVSTASTAICSTATANVNRANKYYVLDGTACQVNIGPQEVIDVTKDCQTKYRVVVENVYSAHRETFNKMFFVGELNTKSTDNRPSFTGSYSKNQSRIGVFNMDGATYIVVYNDEHEDNILFRADDDTNPYKVLGLGKYSPMTTINTDGKIEIVSDEIVEDPTLTPGETSTETMIPASVDFIDSTNAAEPQLCISYLKLNNGTFSPNFFLSGSSSVLIFVDGVMIGQGFSIVSQISVPGMNKLMNDTETNEIYYCTSVSMILEYLRDKAISEETRSVRVDGYNTVSMTTYTFDGFTFTSTLSNLRVVSSIKNDVTAHTKTTKQLIEHIPSSTEREYTGNVHLTFSWDNIPMVILSPIQSIVLTLRGMQLTQEIMPVNIANTTNVGSSIVSTIPIIQNFFSFASSMRDLHDELLITKENFDTTATYKVATTAGQERVVQLSAKYITKDGKVHQIYIPKYGVFTIQLIFGISYYSTA